MFAETGIYYMKSTAYAANGNEAVRAEKLLAWLRRPKRSMYILNTSSEDANRVNSTWTCSGGLLDYC